MTDRLSFTRIGNAARRVEDTHRMNFGDDVGALGNRLTNRFEVVVLREVCSIRVEHEGETLVSINLGERPIDSDRLMTRLDRRLAFFNFDGDMSVHDQAALRIDAEVAEDLATEIFLVNQFEVGILGFDASLLLGNKVVFEG